MGGRGASSGAGGNSLQKHFESENARIQAFMDKKIGENGDSIEMSNGQILEHYTMKDMKNNILKEFKGNGSMYEDDAVSILYKDGSVQTYVGGDDTGDMKLTNIKGVIYDNANTSAYAGDGIKIENYKELFPSDYPDEKGYEDDWRIDFK